MTRIVALGASNLTRGFQTVVATARSMAGPRAEVVAALGHGRSYGMASRLMVRTLPGILQSGLWHQLEVLPPAPTRALVTDVGNDVLYGMPAIHIRPSLWRSAWQEILRMAAVSAPSRTPMALRPRTIHPSTRRPPRSRRTRVALLNGSRRSSH
jgi:hypothetical protein